MHGINIRYGDYGKIKKDLRNSSKVQTFLNWEKREILALTAGMPDAKKCWDAIETPNFP